MDASASRSGTVRAVPRFTLANGTEIPAVGLGMDQVPDPAVAVATARTAIEIGYRSIDTASAYGNEAQVGRAIQESGVPRAEIFVSTKVDGPDHGYDRTRRAFDAMLGRFGFDYVDMYLIHWPGKYLFPETWRAMEGLYLEGRARAIGVCNFNVRHLERLRDQAQITPMVDQVEWHPYFQQPELAEYCAAHGILVEAWSPLMCGGVVLSDPAVVEIARRTGRTPAQVILRWHVQQGRRVFPKSVHPERMAQNIELFDFALADDDLARIDDLARHGVRIGPDPDVFFLK